jgi:hypothetical protein
MGESGQQTPTAAVAYNMRRLREVREMSQRTVGGQMRRLGHRWNDTTVSRVESGTRDVTVDELVGLGVVLGWHPLGLLTPRAQTVVLGDGQSIDAERFSQWLKKRFFVLLAIGGGLIVVENDAELRAVEEALAGEEGGEN